MFGYKKIFFGATRTTVESNILERNISGHDIQRIRTTTDIFFFVYHELGLDIE